MSHLDPIAFTYEADVHCESCTRERFNGSTTGIDSEGNEVGAIFQWDEWYANDVYEGNKVAKLHCGDCHEVIDEVDLS